jgi:hypothetical protein
MTGLGRAKRTESEEGTMFRLLPGIFDIVRLRGKGAGLKTRHYKGNERCEREKGAIYCAPTKAKERGKEHSQE